jgi:hypothetical protein
VDLFMFQLRFNVVTNCEFDKFKARTRFATSAMHHIKIQVTDFMALRYEPTSMSCYRSSKGKFVAEHAEELNVERTKKEIIAEQRAFALTPPTGPPVLYNPALKSATSSSLATTNSTAKVAASDKTRAVAQSLARKAADESQDEQTIQYTLFQPPGTKVGAYGKTTFAGTQKSAAVARPFACLAKYDESQDQQTIPYTLLDLFAFKKTLSIDTVSTPPRLTSSRGSFSEELVPSLEPESSEKQPKVFDDDDDESYDPNDDDMDEVFYDSFQQQIQDEHLVDVNDGNEPQPPLNTPAKRSNTIFYLSALFVLVCALGWCFGQFGTLPLTTRDTHFPCFETNMPDVEDDSRESWSNLMSQ